MVKISLIMPIYNGEKYLENSIESVNRQTLKDIELICINDGSTDNSLELLHKFAKKYSFIKVFSQKNQGSGKARNEGIKKANGKYIAFLDADDIFIDNNALNEMYNVAIENDAKMVGANLKRINSKGDIQNNPNYRTKKYMHFNEFTVIPPQDYGIPWAFYKNIYKKEFLIDNNIRFPDLKRGQDPIFLAKILVLIDAIYTTPVNLYGYNFSVFGRPENKINTFEKKRDYIQHFKEVFDIFEDELIFNKVSQKFKAELMSFLKLSAKNNDMEIYKIFHNIFDNQKQHLSKQKNEIDLFDLNYFIYCLDNLSDEDKFETLKNNILNIDLTQNHLVPNELLRKVLLINGSNDLNEYKTKLNKFNFLNLTHENKKLLNKNKKLLNKNKNLKNKLKKTKELHNNIIFSSSLKITKPLRVLKRFFKG